MKRILEKYPVEKLVNRDMITTKTFTDIIEDFKKKGEKMGLDSITINARELNDAFVLDKKWHFFIQCSRAMLDTRNPNKDVIVARPKGKSKIGPSLTITYNLKPKEESVIVKEPNEKVEVKKRILSKDTLEKQNEFKEFISNYYTYANDFKNSRMTINTIEEHYAIYCNARGLEVPKSNRGMFARIQELFPKVTKVQIGTSTNRIIYVRGLKFIGTVESLKNDSGIINDDKKCEPVTETNNCESIKLDIDSEREMYKNIDEFSELSCTSNGPVYVSGLDIVLSSRYKFTDQEFNLYKKFCSDFNLDTDNIEWQESRTATIEIRFEYLYDESKLGVYRIVAAKFFAERYRVYGIILRSNQDTPMNNTPTYNDEQDVIEPPVKTTTKDIHVVGEYDQIIEEFIREVTKEPATDDDVRDSLTPRMFKETSENIFSFKCIHRDSVFKGVLIIIKDYSRESIISLTSFEGYNDKTPLFAMIPQDENCPLSESFIKCLSFRRVYKY